MLTSYKREETHSWGAGVCIPPPAPTLCWPRPQPRLRQPGAGTHRICVDGNSCPRSSGRTVVEEAGLRCPSPSPLPPTQSRCGLCLQPALCLQQQPRARAGRTQPRGPTTGTVLGVVSPTTFSSPPPPRGARVLPGRPRPPRRGAPRRPLPGGGARPGGPAPAAQPLAPPRPPQRSGAQPPPGEGWRSPSRPGPARPSAGKRLAPRRAQLRGAGGSSSSGGAGRSGAEPPGPGKRLAPPAVAGSAARGRRLRRRWDGWSPAPPASGKRLAPCAFAGSLARGRRRRGRVDPPPRAPPSGKRLAPRARLSRQQVSGAHRGRGGAGVARPRAPSPPKHARRSAGQGRGGAWAARVRPLPGPACPAKWRTRAGGCGSVPWARSGEDTVSD